MDITEVRFGFSRRISDGNFGSEEASAQVVATLQPGQQHDLVLAELASVAVGHVYGRLSQSRSPNVRRAVAALSEAERSHDAHQSDRDAWEKDAQRYVEKPEVDEEDDPTTGGL